MSAPGSAFAASYLPVLTYHRVADPSESDDGLAVAPEMIRAQWGALRDAGYSLVGLTEALQTSGKVVAITVDDAYTDMVGLLPIMAEFDARATLYVPAGHIGGRATWMKAQAPLLDAHEIKDVAAQGIEVGSHALMHTPLDTIDPVGLEAEVVESRRILRETVDQPIDSFCYPHGYWNKPSRGAVERAGYTNACVLGHGLHRRGTDLMTVRRLLVTYRDDASSVLKRCTSTVPSLRRIVTTAGYGPWREVRRTLQRIESRR